MYFNHLPDCSDWFVNNFKYLADFLDALKVIIMIIEFIVLSIDSVLGSKHIYARELKLYCLIVSL